MNCKSKRVPQVHCKVSSKNQRDIMTDRHLIAQLEFPDKGKIDLVAIFDGHSSPQVAEELLSIFPEILAEKLDQLTNIHAPLEVTDAIYKSIITTDYKMYQGCNLHGGSTAIIALWPHNDNYLYIANIGDSKAIVWSGKELILETVSHIPNREKERIRASGGTISGGLVAGKLDVSRSLGYFSEDLKLLEERYVGVKAPVSIRPDVYRIDLDSVPGKIHMVLASDGLWDVMTGQQVMQSFNNTNDCTDIITQAIDRGSSDNITVMLVDIPQCKAQMVGTNDINWRDFYSGYFL